ncbi:subtilisin-like protein, partial [Thozetella sp. PMI_491]
PKATGNADVLSSLKMADVDKLHALGIKGKGVKIGILDTGVDYRHPSLGGGFGPGYKIVGGHAFRDDNDGAVSIADPLATCFGGGHGTHVAGIIGMQDPEDIGFGLLGVAPEAEIYMYRIFGCDGGAYTDDIIAALDMALSDGVDLVSMSLGVAVPWQGSDPFQAATSALVSAGIAVIAAAGNDGADGFFYPSAPATGGDVIAVGSIENSQFPTVYAAHDSTGKDFNYASIWPLTSPTGGRKVYVLGGNGDGCDESQWSAAKGIVTEPSETIIVLHGNGGADCTTAVKEAYWQEYGFAYIMTYYLPSTDPYQNQYILLDQSDNTTQYTNILTDDGADIAANYAAAGGYPNYQISFTNSNVSSVSMATGGSMSFFSSYGPTWDTLEIKPQLSAPGASILATWPLGFNSGYAAIRGTSMATPFVAGAYALVKSQRPDLSVQQIRELLQSTSTPVSSAYYPNELATIVQQGSGLVNPYRALNYASIVTPTQFEIGDADNFVGKKFEFTITNNSPGSQTYKISHKGAGLVEYDPVATTPYSPSNPPPPFPFYQSIYAALEFSSDELTIDAGASTTISFQVTPPADIDQDNVPVISGIISILSGSGETFSLPYEGLPYSRRNAKYINIATVQVTEDLSMPWPFMYEEDPDLGNYTFYNDSGIMVLDKRPIIIHDYIVGLLFGIMQPSANVRADLLPANTTLVPTYYGYDRTAEWNYILTTEPYRNMMEDTVTPTYGLIGGYNPFRPFSNIIDWEDCTVITTDPKYDDEGGVAPTSVGDYRILLSALRWGGNITNPNDWESWLSPV